MMMKRNIKHKIKKSHTVTHMAKITKHSLIYCHNGTLQLQIQLMERLQKAIAKDSITVKAWRSATLLEILKCLKHLAVISLDRCKNSGLPLPLIKTRRDFHR